MKSYYTSPSLIDICVTKRCNLKCDYCSASACPNYDNTHELSALDFKKIFDEIDEMHVHRISLGGGEPFIRNDFFEILDAAVKHNFATIINTNATLINAEIAQRLSNYSFDRICVTLDGSTKEIHECHRGKDTFFKVIQGIRNLQKHKLPISTLFTLNADNISDLINTIKFNEELGIEYMTVMVVCPTGRASSDNLITKEKWYPLFLKLTEMKLNNEIKLNFKIVPPNESNVFWLYYFPLKYYNKLDLLYLWNQELPKENSKREISCYAGVKSLSIDENGDVYGCDLMTGIKEFVAGNLKEQSLYNIWHYSPVFKEFREAQFSMLTGKCATCENTWCGGGCRSAAYNMDKSFYGSDLSCFAEVSNDNT